MIWPKRAGKDNFQHWKQTSNPMKMTKPGVTGYQAIACSHKGNRWGGLEQDNGKSSLLDGSVDHGHWYYAVGSTHAWGGAIPGPDSKAVKVVELWVRVSHDEPVKPPKAQAPKVNPATNTTHWSIKPIPL